MKKILFIATGGTIASKQSDQGLQPGFDGKELLFHFPEANALADISVLELCHLDSTNLHPSHWTMMIEAGRDN